MYGIVKFYLKTNNYTKQEMKITYICKISRQTHLASIE